MCKQTVRKKCAQARGDCSDGSHSLNRFQLTTCSAGEMKSSKMSSCAREQEVLWFRVAEEDTKKIDF